MPRKGRMITINTESMVEQRCLIKQMFTDVKVGFETFQKRTRSGHFYYVLTWNAGSEEDGQIEARNC